MSKPERKFTRPNTYTDTIRGVTLTAEGRTRREAEKRLRTAFLARGIATLTNNKDTDPTAQAYVDLLNMERV